MAVGVAGFKDFVPPMHLGLIQADLPKHSDPFIYVYMVLHINCCAFTSVRFVQQAITE